MSPDEANIAVLENATGIAFQQRPDGSYQAAQPLTQKQMEGLLALRSSKAMGAQAAYEALVGGDEAAFTAAMKAGKPVRLQFTPQEMSEAAKVLTEPSSIQAIREALGTKEKNPQLQARSEVEIGGESVKPQPEVVIGGESVKPQAEVLLGGEPVRLKPEVEIGGEPAKPQAEVVLSGEPVKLKPEVILSGEVVNPKPDVLLSGEAVNPKPDVILSGEPVRHKADVILSGEVVKSKAEVVRRLPPEAKALVEAIGKNLGALGGSKLQEADHSAKSAPAVGGATPAPGVQR